MAKCGIIVRIAFGAANRLEGDHDKISTDRPSRDLIAGRNYVCDGPISTGHEKSEPLWLLRLQWLLGLLRPTSLCAILLILLSNALLRSGLSRPTLRLQGLVLLAIARSAAVKLRLASGSLALFFTIRRNVWNC